MSNTYRQGLGVYQAPIQPNTIQNKENKQMETIRNFTLSFSKEHFQINFNHDANAPVFKVEEPYESQKYQNALVAIMLDYYPKMERGLYLHGESFSWLADNSLDEKNAGYAYGWKASELLKTEKLEDGHLIYVLSDSGVKVRPIDGNLDLVAFSNIYRIAFNGFEFYAHEIPWRAFDEDEGKWAKHNRNALQAIKHLELLWKACLAGRNIVCRYWPEETPLYEGEKGLQAKYLLWKAGNTDTVRAMVNEGIMKGNAYAIQRQYTRSIERLEEDPDDTVAARTKARIEGANAKSEKMFDVDGNPITMADLNGKVVQLSAGENLMTPQYNCTDEETLNKVCAQLRKGLTAKFVAESEVQAPAVKKQRRNVPQIVK
jgi:hypothetical protein